ncbi:Lipocalin-like domain-containing protein [Lasiosphaeria hispida]|uniref:Lipocalin-like domain-containing protein n=1 Tax=Lasiosphaeria hispida TaxID=260671 RepID=A0AAJ0HKX0_9PEZI|nr:Lipocalin-like domain-containing protein [Lasiosphaeria hispida]
MDLLAKLAGSYILVNTTAWNNGTELPNSLGNNYTGILTYTRTGWMSANLASTDAEFSPQNITWPPRENNSDTDWLLAAKHALSYAGQLSVSDAYPATEEEGQLIHGPLTVSSLPSWRGTLQLRNYTVYKRDDGVFLKIWAYRGDFKTHIWWKRLD